MSAFTDAVEAEAREMQRLRTDRDRWKKRATKLKDERDELLAAALDSNTTSDSNQDRDPARDTQ